MATRRTGLTNQERTPLIARRPQQQKRHDPYSPISHDLDKEDRRSILGRVASSAMASLSTMLWPKFVPNNDAFNNETSPRSCSPDSDLIASHHLPQEDGYYEDSYNDLPWRCSFGTREEDGIWLNRSDQAGFIMSIMVWLLIIYSGFTVTLLAHHNHVPKILAMAYCTSCALALSSHAKTTFTDPGAIPQAALPLTRNQPPAKRTTHVMCSHCQSYKPPLAHHCRICNRCIARMDHHCPWMNNCVGIGNMKHFILFLMYTWIASAWVLLIFMWNFFLCVSSHRTESCSFSPMVVQLVRAMTCIALGAFIFTSSMLTNVLHAVMTGVGTIDRLKQQASKNQDVHQHIPVDDPIPWRAIFGIQGYWTWCLPMDPVFEDCDQTFGYSTPQRMLREQQRLQTESSYEGRDDSPTETDSRGYSQV